MEILPVATDPPHRTGIRDRLPNRRSCRTPHGITAGAKVFWRSGNAPPCARRLTWSFRQGVAFGCSRPNHCPKIARAQRDTCSNSVACRRSFPFVDPTHFVFLMGLYPTDGRIAPRMRQGEMLTAAKEKGVGRAEELFRILFAKPGREEKRRENEGAHDKRMKRTRTRRALDRCGRVRAGHPQRCAAFFNLSVT